MKTVSFEPGDSAAVVGLRRDCGLVVSWNDPHGDIRRKLAVQPEMFLVGYLNDGIVASVMAGYDGHRGWICYLAVHPDNQHTGPGRIMMEEAEKRLRVSGCPKINLQVRTGNAGVIEDYKRTGCKTDREQRTVLCEWIGDNHVNPGDGRNRQSMHSGKRSWSWSTGKDVYKRWCTP